MPRTGPFNQFTDQYEDWFAKNRSVFQSELNALRKVVPAEGRGIEIGVGSGIFARPLGITEGVDPSAPMRARARERDIHAVEGIAEALPFEDRSFDFAVMVTTICFVDDPERSLQEANRILIDSGTLVMGFVDKDSPVGKKYLEHREESVFYKDAVFYGTDELIGMMEKTGFGIREIHQTVFGELEQVRSVQESLKGYGKGSFVVIAADKINHFGHE